MNNIKKEVVNARVNLEWTYSKIFDVYDVAKSTAQGWVAKYHKEQEDTSQTDFEDEFWDNVQPDKGYSHSSLQRERPPSFKRTEEEVFDFLEQLAPIEVKSDYKQISSDLSDYAVVGSDFHFGCEDPSAIAIFLETINQLKPRTIVLNGDTMDMLAVSRYPKDVQKQWSLQDERLAYHSFLDALISVAGGAKIFETVSNHSGQSIDGRWRRYLSSRIGELASLPDIAEKLSYQNIFMGDYQEHVEHVDYVELGDLVVTHGTTVRKNGGYSARGEIEKWGASILHGHTHRIGMTGQRIPALGRREEQQIIGFEGGCLCDLNPGYGLAMNWQQGFNIVGLSDDGSFSMEPVMINKGKANISTLNMTIEAE